LSGPGLPGCSPGLPVVGTACQIVSGAAGSAASAGVGTVFDAAGHWVADGALWLLDQVGTALNASTAPPVAAGWFGARLQVMTGLAAAVVLPLLCCATVQAVVRQSPALLVRAFFVHLPVALVLTGTAVAVVHSALGVTDEFSAQLLAGGGTATRELLAPVASFLGGVGGVDPGVPAFVIFIAGIVVAAATLVLWLELVVRAAAVSAAVLFLPLVLAAAVWPALGHWCRRLADTIAALVLSKLVVAAVLSLAAAALAGGTGAAGAAGAPTGGFAAVVTGVALLVVAACCPFMVLRLVPAVEAGALAHLESLSQRARRVAVDGPRRAGAYALQLAQLQGAGGALAFAGESAGAGPGPEGGGFLGRGAATVLGGGIGQLPAAAIDPADAARFGPAAGDRGGDGPPPGPWVVGPPAGDAPAGGRPAADVPDPGGRPEAGVVRRLAGGDHGVGDGGAGNWGGDGR